MDTIIDFEREAAKYKSQAEYYSMCFTQQQLLPHRNYGVSLSNDGVSWIASLVMDETAVLVGRGDSPQEALTDFDLQWSGAK